MLEGEVTRKEVEARLATAGDYVKMDYLQSCLKKQMDFDTKKFVLTKLSAIYESRKMFMEAGKMMRNAADINITDDGKINDFVKSMDLFIKSGNFDEADGTYRRALGSANSKQKTDVKAKIKVFYKTQARELIAKDRRRHALEIYERLLALELDPSEKKEIQKTILELYGKLGKVKEFYTLQRGLENTSPGSSQQKEVKKEPRDTTKDNFEFDY